MSRTFNAFDKATIKNSAKAVAHYQAQNEKLEEKINEIRKQQEMNNVYIEQYSKPVRELTGFEPLALCEKKPRGNQNDWVFIYPDTIVPPEETPEVAEEPVNGPVDLVPEESEEEVKEEPIIDLAPSTVDEDEDEDDDMFKDDEF